MFKSVVSKVAWVGRTASMVFGLALVLALMFGVASMALAGTGVGDTFNLGKQNTVNRISSLIGSASSAMLKIDNNGAGPALALQVDPSAQPMSVNSDKRVSNLNADKVDNLDSSALGVTMKTSMGQIFECASAGVWGACAPVTVTVPAGKQYNVTVWSSFTTRAYLCTGCTGNNFVDYCPAIKGGSFVSLTCITQNGQFDDVELPHNVGTSAASSAEIGPLPAGTYTFSTAIHQVGAPINRYLHSNAHTTVMVRDASAPGPPIE